MKRISAFVLLLIIFFTMTTVAYASDSTDVSVDDHLSSVLELKKLGDLNYYLYTPSDPTEDMPLIVYLHGGTNKNLYVTALLTTDGFPKYLNDGYYGDLRAYVVIPKLDNSYKGWVNVYEQIRDLVRVMKTDYAVGKVALTGHSMGGTGTYQVQTKLPNTFTCIAPMSGSVQNTEANITALSKTKIWAFVGTADTIVDPDSTRTVIAALKENGADARITELEGATHFDVPELAYKNDELIRWLVNGGETDQKTMLGDVDDDKTVTIIDTTCIQRHLASIPTYAYIEKAADTDEDGEVTIIDATCIQRWLVDLPSNYRIGQLIREENSDSDEDFSFLNDKPVCPECGSENVAYIIYGYPMPEEYYSAAFRQKLENGEITFGGCVIDPDSPKWQCNDCGYGIK